MKILFCKIAHMRCYKGIYDNDKPYNGGDYVQKTGDAHEKYNFDPVFIDDRKEEVCLGFFETKSTNGTDINQLHIEKIKGCELLKKADKVDDVLVVWCATSDTKECVVVGWYKHATVYRYYLECLFKGETDENDYIQSYNIIADYKNCVLLPDDGTRRRWTVPSSRKNAYGFGQSLIWYAREKEAEDYLKSLVEKINSYNGENWIDKYPDELQDIITI